MDDMMDDELLQEFITEAREHLHSIEADLLTIEEQGEQVDLNLVNKVFRAAHSIKGGSGFFGLEKVKTLAHSAETVLDMLRAGKMFPNAEVTNVLLNAFDQLRDMINRPLHSDQVDTDDLLRALNALASSYLPSSAEKQALSSRAVLRDDSGIRDIELPQVDVDRAQRTGQSIYRVEYDLIHDIEKRGISALDLFNRLAEYGEILDCSLDFAAVGTLDDDIGNSLPLVLIYAVDLPPEQAANLLMLAPSRVEQLSSLPTAVPPTAPRPVVTPPPLATVQTPPQSKPVPKPDTKPVKPAGSAAASESGGSVVEETLRVHVSLLENLMNLAGELVLGRNQLRAAIARNNPQALAKANQQLNQVTSELQEAIMQTRLQPIGHLFGKFPRVVRDMAKTLNKEIRVDILGKDVELDRSLLEGLSDPLTHMIRNAADHGLETPQERIAAGKCSEGALTISASHEAGQVIIEIADDGRGIDPDNVAASALKKGQVSEDKLAGMSDQEKLELIMMPGFSTAEKVSEFSGRGVGMDVVKTNLNKLGGQVEIRSRVGLGTNFRIKLPLTLAIIPSLIVSLEEERFAIPQVNVEELLRIRAEEVKNRIEIVGGAEVLLLRDKTLPLVRFDRFLEIVPTYVDPVTGRRELDRREALADRRSPRHALQGEDPSDFVPEKELAERTSGRRTQPKSALEIVVICSGTTRYGLVVGGFHDTEEIVVKPLGRHLETLTEYAGATILGDGSVALIIDAAGLAEKAELMAVSASQRALELQKEAEQRRLEDHHALLLFHNAPDEQCAISLDNVLRIERIRRKQVEVHGQKRTMQYRGASLPLVTLADSAQVKAIEPEQELVVLVSQVRDREIGLLGAMPVDVVDVRTQIDTVTHRQPGIIGSTIINDETVMISDIHELVDAVHPQWGRQQKAATMATPVRPADDEAPAASSTAPTLLLAEDSDFFRQQVRRFLESAGYRVIAAPDGEAAWEKLLANLSQIQLVVTDIEMPRLNGLELCQRIRRDPRTVTLPVIAVSSLAADDDRERGLEAGVTEYQVKLDQDALVGAIGRLLGQEN